MVTKAVYALTDRQVSSILDCEARTGMKKYIDNTVMLQTKSQDRISPVESKKGVRLILFKDVLLRTRRALVLLYKVYGEITLPLNRSLLNSANALLALIQRYVHHMRKTLL